MKQLRFILLSSILIFFAVLSVLSASRESLTYDEIVDLQEGRNAVLNHTFDIDPYNPPLTREIGVVPFLFTKGFYQSPESMYNNPLPGRLTMLLLGIILLLCVWKFTRKYFGEKEAFLATLLLSLEPTILANSHYFTMDIGLTLFFFLSFWILLELILKPAFEKYVLLGVLVGLGTVSKISFIPYFLLAAIGIVVYQQLTAKTKLKIQWKYILASLIMCGVVVWLPYFFKSNVIIKERVDSSRVSQKLLTYAISHHNQLLKNAVIFGEKQNIPFGDFFATIKNNALRSTQGAQCFFIGRYFPSCQWYFILGNLLVKIPLPIYILVGVSLFVFAKEKKKGTFVFLAIPILSVLIVACALRTVPYVRYVLPLYPFLIILASCSLQFWTKTVLRKGLLVVILVWYFYAFLSAFPHFISYANELSGQKKYMVLMDSNLDWGQSLPDVGQFHKKNPTAQIRLSYFGRDNGNTYGLKSNKVYGGYKANDICEFHSIGTNSQKQITIISVSNWWECGYYKMKEYNRENIVGTISDSFLIFK